MSIAGYCYKNYVYSLFQMFKVFSFYMVLMENDHLKDTERDTVKWR